ncbi:MAG: stage 0 sporulation protein [bacterium]|nr:stage 0 sporulation protein [bacterium]
MEISAVKLRNSYQVYYVDTNHLFIQQNTLSVVETEHGIDIGKVMKHSGLRKAPKVEVQGKLLRKATPKDIEQIPEIVSVEKRAFDVCKEKTKSKKLAMKLVSVKCLFDKTKIIFYFVAENRIDFRELVRELASVFRTRIEMRQIGVRDEARLVGGFGPCGREHCCGHQREEFDPVSIKMAKEQSLNLNSLKISGMCGRLLCCLGYEYNTYKEQNKNLPKQGSQVFAEDRSCFVLSVDTLKEMLRVKDNDRVLEISKFDLELINNKYSIKKEVLEKLAREEIEEDENNGEEFY